MDCLVALHSCGKSSPFAHHGLSALSRLYPPVSVLKYLPSGFLERLRRDWCVLVLHPSLVPGFNECFTKRPETFQSVKVTDSRLWLRN